MRRDEWGEIVIDGRCTNSIDKTELVGGSIGSISEFADFVYSTV